MGFIFFISSFFHIMTPTYAEPEEVMALVRDPSKHAGKDYIVIDVRGDDYIVKYRSTFVKLFINLLRVATFQDLLMFQPEECMMK